MSEWKYIDSIVELSDFECAHCDTRDFCMVVYDTIDEPWDGSLPCPTHCVFFHGRQNLTVRENS